MELREFIETTARSAGEIALQFAESLGTIQIETKATDKDIVTAADREVEDFIIGKIRQAYPDHSILGEENGMERHSDSPFCWVIDPIDGTAAYEHGQPCYSVSIALQKNGKTIAGCVYAPKMNELFYGEQGKGAFLNDKPIHVSDRNQLVACTGVTGFACLRANLQKNNLPVFCAIAPVVREMRRYGSAALDLAYVACGRVDLEWEHPLKLYDIAAGIILVKEAGGRITDFDGGDEYPRKGTLSTNGLIHEEVRAIILEHDFR